MTLTEVLIQLSNIRNRVSSTDFPTNINKIEPNIISEWVKWNIKFHTEDEDRIRECTINDAWKYIECLMRDMGLREEEIEEESAKFNEYMSGK